LLFISSKSSDAMTPQRIEVKLATLPSAACNVGRFYTS